MSSSPVLDVGNQAYLNWVKAGLVLGQLKAGLQEFVWREMEQIHVRVTQRVKSQLPPSASLSCTQCSSHQLRKLSYKCPNRVCSLLLAEAKVLHRFQDPKMRNIDLETWGDSARVWELAKLFLPDGFSQGTSAADTDCSGLMSLIINRKAFSSKMTIGLHRPSNECTQVRNLRNVVMHSPSLCLSGGELSQLVRDSLAILNDRTSLKLDPAAQRAAGNIETIQKGELEISLRDQLEVLAEAKEAVVNARGLDELRSAMELQREDLETMLSTETRQLETNIQKQKDELEKTRMEIAEFQNRQKKQIEMLESVIKTIAAKAEKLENDVGHMKEAVDEVTRRAGEIATDVTTLTEEARERKENITTITSDVVVLGRRVETLENHRKTQQLSDTDGLELKQDLVDSYTDLLTTVSVSKWNKTLRLEDIFTPIIIREDLEKRLAQAGLDRRKLQVLHPGADSKPISSYDEVFLKDKVLQTDIYVIGKAGVGKSLFTLQLVNLWCKVQTNEPANATERMLKQFELVFYVSCRYAKKPKEFEEWDSLLEMIIKQNCHGNKRYEGIAREILESSTRQCLILLDGLDEWAASASEKSTPLSRPGIPDRHGLCNCVVLTTSRPWRVEALPNGVGRTCRVLEIVGLDRKGVKQLARNLLTALNEENSQAAAEIFLRDVWDLKMEELVKVPLMLTNIVVSWHDSGHKLDKSRCANYSGMLEALIHRSGRTLGQNLPDMNASGSEANGHAVPQCFESRKLCRQYWPLILKLASLAFQSLLSEEMEKSLVFSKQDLVGLLGESELEECLKIGILSQCEAESESSLRMVTVSFLHKSVQEFLAALWMSRREEFDGCFQTFRSRCKDLNDVFDFLLIITFLSGLDPKRASQVYCYVHELVEKHRGMAEYEISAAIILHELFDACIVEAACRLDQAPPQQAAVDEQPAATNTTQAGKLQNR